jgi:hypothetical protein
MLKTGNQGERVGLGMLMLMDPVSKTADMVHWTMHILRSKSQGNMFARLAQCLLGIPCHHFTPSSARAAKESRIFALHSDE